MLNGFGFVRNGSRLTHDGSQAILKTVNHLYRCCRDNHHC